MKKFSLIVLVMLIPFVALAASYGDNQYQKLAEAYTVRAQDAFDSGEYDLAVEYTIKAEENAELSRQYVEMMLLRSEADTQIRVARNRLVWARSIKADENFPEMYNESMSLVEQAQVAFSGESTKKQRNWPFSLWMLWPACKRWMMKESVWKKKPLPKRRKACTQNTTSSMTGTRPRIVFGILPQNPLYTMTPTSGRFCMRQTGVFWTMPPTLT